MDLDRLRTTEGLDVDGKRVLVRADLNVPVQDGQVTDATRLERVLPGIEDLAKRGARVVLISHLGRPKGRPDPQYSLRPVADKLAELAGRRVAFVPECIGEPAAEAVAALRPGDVAVLENLRFHAGEEKNDGGLAQALAKLGDIFVGDAFSTAHRAHASTDAITRLLPSYAGPLLMEEVAALRRVLERPERPVAAVVGGAKVSTKIAVLTHLTSKVDKLIVGGAMANTFLLAQGLKVGTSLVEPDLAETARDIIAAAKARGCEVVLPADAVVAARLEAGVPTATCSVAEVPDDRMILDVGPQAVAHYTQVLGQCRTLLWNGPLGAFETPPFGEGTFQFARAAAAATQDGRLVSVAGGGDTVAALNAAGVADQLTYVSTAGGAFLEWLEGRDLPGIRALAAAAG